MWSLWRIPSRRAPEQKPIRYAPEHRPEWRGLRRYCRCGLRWPCLDRHRTVPAVPPYPMQAPGDRR